MKFLYDYSIHQRRLHKIKIPCIWPHHTKHVDHLHNVCDVHSLCKHMLTQRVEVAACVCFVQFYSARAYLVKHA